MVAGLYDFRDTWSGDGTFKVHPSHLYQLYTVHIHSNGYYPPCIYAILSNKKESTYRKFLAVINYLSYYCVHSRNLIEFEKAGINNFKEAYPESSIRGCYFHLCQSF